MTVDSKNKTILLVDDDIDFLFQMKTYLEGQGYDVVSAEGQTEAEELVKTMQPDLAILDLMMENVDAGFTLAYHIKKINSNIPVIIVTAVASETGLEFDASTDEEKSWIKADALLAKPIRFEQLQKEINRLTEGK